jgi:hypothetical protein
VRRALALAVVALVLVGCAQETRPEGVVENWLRSLNQGAAGRPDRYAPEEVSATVLPGWHDLDPGHLDAIVVGTPRTTDVGSDVPFRIVDVDGVSTIGVARLEMNGGSWHVASVETGLPPETVDLRPLSSGGLPVGWPTAVALAGVFIALALGLLTLVQRRATRGAERNP